MSNDYLNIAGFSVNSIKTVIKFVVTYFIDKESNEIVSAFRQMPGDLLMLPDNKIVDEGTYLRYLMYDESSLSNTAQLPIPLVVPATGLTCYIKQSFIDIDKTNFEVILNSNDQSCDNQITIKSNIDLYFDINNVGYYSFDLINNHHQSTPINIYSCEVEIHGMQCMPGQTSIIETILNVYSDNAKTNKIAEKNIIIDVIHESNGTPD